MVGNFWRFMEGDADSVSNKLVHDRAFMGARVILDGLPDLPDLGAPSSALAPYQAIVPGALPIAFTNPFLIDVDGGGWEAPGLP